MKKGNYNEIHRWIVIKDEMGSETLEGVIELPDGSLKRYYTFEIRFTDKQDN